MYTGSGGNCDYTYSSVAFLLKGFIMAAIKSFTRNTINTKNIGEAISASVNARILGDNNIQAVLEFCVVQSIKGYNATPSTMMLDAMVAAVNEKGAPAFSQREVDLAVDFVMVHGYIGKEVINEEGEYKLVYVKPDFENGDMAKPVLSDYPSWKKAIPKPAMKAPIDAFQLIAGILDKHERNANAKNKADEFGFTPEIIQALMQLKGKAELASLAQQAARKAANDAAEKVAA